jgi:hypothetical protein
MGLGRRAGSLRTIQLGLTRLAGTPYDVFNIMGKEKKCVRFGGVFVFSAKFCVNIYFTRMPLYLPRRLG